MALTVVTSPTKSSAGVEIWTVEGVAHTILFYLDLQSFDAVLSVIQAANELNEYLQDSVLWIQMSKMHFGGKRDEQLQIGDGSFRDRGWDWSNRECTCIELQEFMQSIDDRNRFEKTVSIVEGDIEHVDNIDGTPLDGIAFPTSSSLMNPNIGAAGAVFRRAGSDLDDFMTNGSFHDDRPVGLRWFPAGTVMVTPGFATGVNKLIHCVGPSGGTTNCYHLLDNTYELVMNSVQREELQCVAVVSVSTGNLGVPCVEGAQVALRVIQRFLVKEKWQGKLAVVCNDERVLQAFNDEKTAIIDKFNIVPDLPPAPENDLSW